MWQTIAGRLPSLGILLCALLSVLIPWGVQKINKLLHKLGDPPWKNDRDPI